jgi:hypothetical protein
LAAVILSNSARGSGSPVSTWRRHVLEHVPLPAEVFHELARQLDRVPLDAADARHVALVHLREHVVQAVAELVEEGGHVVVREQRRLAVHAAGEVAHQLRDGRLQHAVVGAQPAGAHVVHPGAAALGGAGGGVEVELADLLAAALDAVELHARMPRGRAVAADRHLEQRLDDLEQAGHDLGRGEVLLHLLLAEGVARFLELLADVAPVPGLRVGDAQLLGGEGAQVGQVAFAVGLGLGGQVAQELDDLLGRFGHLRHDRQLTEILVAQQLGFFFAQREDLGDQRRVVEGGIAELAGTRDVGAVELSRSALLLANCITGR